MSRRQAAADENISAGMVPYNYQHRFAPLPYPFHNCLPAWQSMHIAFQSSDRPQERKGWPRGRPWKADDRQGFDALVRVPLAWHGRCVRIVRTASPMFPVLRSETIPTVLYIVVVVMSNGYSLVLVLSTE